LRRRIAFGAIMAEEGFGSVWNVCLWEKREKCIEEEREKLMRGDIRKLGERK